MITKAWKVFCENKGRLTSVWVGRSGWVCYSERWVRDKNIQGPAACFKTEEQAKEFRIEMLYRDRPVVILPVEIVESSETQLWYMDDGCKVINEGFTGLPTGTILADEVVIESEGEEDE